MNADPVSHSPCVTATAGVGLALVPALKGLGPAAPRAILLDPLAVLEGEGDAGLKVIVTVVLDVPDKHGRREAGVLKGEAKLWK